MFLETLLAKSIRPVLRRFYTGGVDSQGRRARELAPGIFTSSSY
jgi:hypothetical protein